MLAGAGLVEGTDYQTVLLDGFDPVAHYALDGIVGFPGYKSNEPGSSSGPGIPFDLFDPTTYGVPGSFGVLFTTRSLVEDHPTAVEDFVRATMQRARRRPRRPGRRGADRHRPRRGQRQPELPVAGGRDVPVADRHRRPSPPTTPAARGIGVPDSDPAAGRARRLRRGRPVRRRRHARADRPRRADRHRPDRRRLRRAQRRHLALLTSRARAWRRCFIRVLERIGGLNVPPGRRPTLGCAPTLGWKNGRRSSDWWCPALTAPERRSPTSRASTACAAWRSASSCCSTSASARSAAGSSPCRCSSPCPAC